MNDGRGYDTQAEYIDMKWSVWIFSGRQFTEITYAFSSFDHRKLFLVVEFPI